jgi:hypothetical protein
MSAHAQQDTELTSGENALPLTDLEWAKNKLEEAEAHAIAVEAIAHHVGALLRGRISKR